jgi:alpha-L-fucosidase
MNENEIVKPTKEQLEWADCEIGVIIHFDMPSFIPYNFREKWGWHPGPEVFNPSMLNTDKWIEAAVSAGAKYAVLVAKHCTGFCLWPTNEYEYSVKNSPYKNGDGDIVDEFIKSCHKYGVKPGLYYSTGCNAYLGVDGIVGGELKGEQLAEYNKIVISQLTELWTKYGELFEIWFDGGCLQVENGGPDVVSLLNKLQPNAVVFQGAVGTKSLIRWGGNERGEASENCWSTTNIQGENHSGVIEVKNEGDPNGTIWAPAESDMPNRDKEKSFQGGWFWREGEDELVYPAEFLLDRYYKSVGRNTNLLLGMVIDNTGVFPKVDTREFAKFGQIVKSKFEKPLGTISGIGNDIVLDLAGNHMVENIVIMEDISKGERVLEYIIEGYDGEVWCKIHKGQCIGHKRIVNISPKSISKVKFNCVSSKNIPIIRELAAY